MKIEIYIPTTSKGQKLKVKSYRKSIELAMCDRFGGCTTVKGKGNWIDNDGELITETVYILTSYQDESKNGEGFGCAKTFAKNIAKIVKYDLSQDCVAYTIDNNMYLV